MNVVFEMTGLPSFNKKLDQTAMVVANPLTREALKAGGTVIQHAAQDLVNIKTGVLLKDIIIVTRILQGVSSADRVSRPGEKYVLIGPGWNPDVYRRVARNRGASGREAAPDYTTNPGIYGYFLEVGHRAPGKGLNSNAEYKRDARAARKQGKRVDTHKYGTLTVPPYPWLGPAFENNKNRAFNTMADVIRRGLASLNL